MTNNRPTSPSKEICTHIFQTIKDNKLENDIKFAQPKLGRKFINIFEYHNEQNASNQFACALAQQLNTKSILLEFPIEINKELKDPNSHSADPEYDKSIQQLKKTASYENIKILCMDRPLSENEIFSQNRNIQQFVLNLMQSRGAFDENWLNDSLRNEFMAHFIYYFTQEQTTITINGIAHCYDLISRLTAMDPSASCLIIEITVQKKAANNIVYISKEISGNHFHCLQVNAYDEASLLDKNLIAQVIRRIYQLGFIDQYDLPFGWQRFFKSAESAKAMLSMDCSPQLK